jgi:hypothetical protein
MLGDWMKFVLFWDITQRRGGNSVPAFRHNLSVPYSTVKKSSWTLKIGPIFCPETSVKGYHLTLRNMPEERRSHTCTSRRKREITEG